MHANVHTHTDSVRCASHSSTWIDFFFANRRKKREKHGKTKYIQSWKCMWTRPNLFGTPNEIFIVQFGAMKSKKRRRRSRKKHKRVAKNKRKRRKEKRVRVSSNCNSSAKMFNFSYLLTACKMLKNLHQRESDNLLLFCCYCYV